MEQGEEQQPGKKHSAAAAVALLRAWASKRSVAAAFQQHSKGEGTGERAVQQDAELRQHVEGAGRDEGADAADADVVEQAARKTDEAGDKEESAAKEGEEEHLAHADEAGDEEAAAEEEGEEEHLAHADEPSAVVIRDPPSQEAWLALAAAVFPDWHAQGLATYHGAGWTIQALVDYRFVR